MQQRKKAAQGVLRKRCRLEAAYSSQSVVFCISGRGVRGLPALFADVQQKLIGNFNFARRNLIGDKIFDDNKYSNARGLGNTAIMFRLDGYHVTKT